MNQNNREPKQYTGTRGLSWAVVIGVAIGTVIGKLMGNMNTGLMIGIVLGVLGWVLLFNRRPKANEKRPDEEAEKPENAEQKKQ